MFERSIHLPKHLPICDGFLYAKQVNAEYSDPFEIKFSLVRERVFTIDGYLNEYQANIMLNGKSYGYKGYGDNLSSFKIESLKDFEKSGFEITAIKDYFGEYLWIKGPDFKHSELYKKYKIAQIYVLRTLIFVCIAMPLIWMLKPILKSYLIISLLE